MQRALVLFSLLLLTAGMQAVVKNKIYLVGDAATVSGLSAVEKNAYDWALATFTATDKQAAYIPFSTISSTGVPSDCGLLWFYYANSSTLPVSSTNASANIATYYNGGGRVFLTGIASKYAVAIGATTVAPNEEGFQSSTPDDAWGVCPVAGQESHAIYAGLTPSTWSNAGWGGYRTIATGTTGVQEAFAWWKQGTFTGTRLGICPWFKPYADLSSQWTPIGEFVKGDGKVLVVSLPGFTWVLNNGTTEQNTLKAFTSNCINYTFSGGSIVEPPVGGCTEPSYVTIPPTVPTSGDVYVVGDATTIAGLPLHEKRAYYWAIANAAVAGKTIAYKSFNDIATNGVPANCKTIWFHYSGGLTLPSSATSAAANISTWLSEDNKDHTILLTGLASKYAVAIGASSVATNEESYATIPAVEVDDAWGICPVSGQEAHPIFAGISASTWSNAGWGGFRTVTAGIEALEAYSWWKQDAFPKSAVNKRLAICPWFKPFNDLSTQWTVVGELRVNCVGMALVVSAPGYGWNLCNSATEQDNLTKFTKNCLNYCYNWSDGATCPQPTGNALSLSLDATGQKAVLEQESNSYVPISSDWSADFVASVKNQGLHFDGSTTYVQGEMISGSTPTTAFTFSAWFALNCYSADKESGNSKSPIFYNSSFEVGVNNWGKLCIRSTVGSIDKEYTNIQVALHKWHNIAVVVDKSAQTLKVFYDGVLVDTQTIPNASFSWNTTYMLGRNSDTRETENYRLNSFNGLIDEVSVKNSAIADATIINTYNTLKPSGDADLRTSHRFENDPHRPLYHPMPLNGWTNEPHGLIYYNSQYHLFYQKNGAGAYWADMNWGHMVSDDLVVWEDNAAVLWPTKNTFDSKGIWSGCVVLDDTNKPTIFYTGVNGAFAGIGMASLSGDGSSWVKSANNPIIATKPAVSTEDDFRDPYVWKDGTTYYMVVGGKLNGYGNLWLYKSTNNMVTWNYVKPFFTGTAAMGDVGAFWEMPVVKIINGKYFVLVNKTPDGTSRARTFYWVGSMVNETFVPNQTTPNDLDLIVGELSPSICNDLNGNTVGIGVIPDTWNAFLNDGTEHKKLGWANIQSIAKQYTLNGNVIERKPYSGLTQLRKSQIVDKTGGAITSSTTGILSNPNGSRQLEIDVTVTPGTASKVGVIVGKGTNGEVTKIYVDYSTNKIKVDRTLSSQNPNAQKAEPAEGNLVLDKNANLNMKVFVDHSVIEVFINDKSAFITRIFPIGADSHGVDLFVEGGTSTLVSAKVYDLLGVSNPIEIIEEDAKDLSLFEIYPNPASTVLNVVAEDIENGNSFYKIVDISGSVVMQGEIVDSAFSLDISSLMAGYYILSIRNWKSIKSKKFVVV